MSPSKINSHTSFRRDVNANLVYWKRPPNGHSTIDFRKPGAEQQFLDLVANEEEHPVIIRDIRGEESQYNLERNGFQYLRHDIPGIEDAPNDARVLKKVISETEQKVRKITGATETIVYAHRIRCFTSGDRAPVHAVHSDFTSVGAMENLRIILNDPERYDALSQGRIMALNVWRPLRTVKRDPLAICDWTSVDHQRDWIPNRFIFPDSWVELGRVQYSESHRWYYLRDQTAQEFLIFKQFDSRHGDAGGCTLAHSAFVDPQYTDCEPRQSLEIGIYVFLPD